MIFPLLIFAFFILLDAAVLMMLIFAVNQGQETDLGMAAVMGIVISIGCSICSAFLGPYLGIFAVVPMIAVAIAIIWMVSGIPLGRATIAGVLFFVFKIVLALVLSAIL